MDAASLVDAVIGAAIAMAVPLLLVALGEMFNQRSGQYNLGAEGIMMMGAFVAFLVDLKLEAPWLGLCGAALVGGLMGWLMGLTSITFRAEQGICGIGLYMFGWGLSGTLFRVYVGGPTPVNGIASLGIPWLARIPAVGPLLAGLNPLDPVVFLLVPLSSWLLLRTTWGLTVRAVGSAPRAADTMGIDVARVRFQCVILAGVTAGLAGAYLTLCQARMFADNLTAGRGFIAVALVYFGRWSPRGIAFGALLFSLAGALQRIIQVFGIPFPYELALIVPHLLVLLVLVASRGRADAEPLALGKPYAR